MAGFFFKGEKQTDSVKYVIGIKFSLYFSTNKILSKVLLDDQSLLGQIRPK